VIGRRSCIVVVDCHADAFETEGHAEHGDDDENMEHAHPVQSWVMGLLVDAVFEVFDRQAEEIEAAPSLGTRIAPEYLRGMTRAGGELVGVLALTRLLSARELAAGIASFQPQ
jgi:chemotaxis signal transduction protein